MRHIVRPIASLITFLSILSTLTACSVATLAYNNAGSLIGYALRDYVELTDSQESWLKERIELAIAWHRTSELPQWQRWLNEARERAAGKPETSEVRALSLRGQALLERTTEQVLPDMAALLRQLDASQIAFLERKFVSDNRKIARDAAVALPQRQVKRVERMRERFESWAGSLSPEQVAYLQSRVLAQPPLDELRLADRMRWQRQFIENIKARPEALELQAALRSMILTPERHRDPVYQAALLRQQEEMMTTIAWMVTSATPAQRTHMQKKLSGYAELLASLVRS